MKPALGEVWRTHLRLALLRLLEQTPGYSANESILADAVRALGLAATRDQVKGELAWLAEQGLVALDDAAGITIATASARGVEVALGLATHPGVKRPSAR